MGWLEEAQKKVKELEKKDNVKDDENLIRLENQKDIDALKKELGKLYENATSREIERAIDYGIEKLGKLCKKSEFLKTIRIKLED